MSIRIKTIHFELEVKFNGPEQYEGRTLDFGAWADVNGVSEGVTAEVEEDGTVTMPSASNLAEAQEAARELCDFVKEVIQKESQPYLDYRKRLRQAKYREVVAGLPSHLRSYLDPTALLDESEPLAEGNRKE